MPAPQMNFDQENQDILPPAGPISQDLEVRVFGSLVTAQRVAVARNEKGILQKLREAAAVNGDNYYYEWETKNRDGTKGLVTGITIKGAMLVVRLFGNCAVDVRAVPFSETHDMFYARFADLETGFSTVRAFKQRRSQNIGMKDKERGEDIIFQIGQSKAIRNVINNALQDFCGDVVEKSRNALIEQMEGDGKFADKVAARLRTLMEKHGVTDKMAETYIGRPLADWLNRHIAKMYVAMKSIDNGDAGVNDVFASETAMIKTDDKKPEGGKEGDGNSGQPATDSGASGKRQPAKRNAAKAGGNNPAGTAAGASVQQGKEAEQTQAPVQDSAAKASAPAAEQSQAGASQPQEQTSAPDAPSTSKSIAQGAPGDNLSGAPTQQKEDVKQPPAPPVDEDGSWFTNEE